MLSKDYKNNEEWTDRKDSDSLKNPLFAHVDGNAEAHSKYKCGFMRLLVKILTNFIKGKAQRCTYLSSFMELICAKILN